MRFPSDARVAFVLLASSVFALAAFVSESFGPLPSRALRSSSAAPPSTSVQAGTEFADVTDLVGLADFKHDIPLGVRSIADAIAPGLGLLDLDEDGDLDLVLLGGPGAATGVSIYVNLLREEGRLRFEDRTARSDLDWRGAAQGVCAGDVDCDGDIDLLVTAIGQNVLLLNRFAQTRELAFVDANEADDEGMTVLPPGIGWHWIRPRASFRAPETRPGPPPAPRGADGPSCGPVPEFSTGASFGDFDQDGDLDLYVANYVCWFEERLQGVEPGQRSEPPQYQPMVFDSQMDRFYVNALDEDDLSFVEMTRAVSANDEEGRGLGAVFMMIDGDLYPDVYVANDASENVFLRNVPAGPDDAHGVRRRFRNETSRFGLSDPKSGMGIARGDADGDADLDLLTTNWRKESVSLFLFRLELKLGDDGEERPEPTFEKRSETTGLARPSEPFVGWGCVFFDYDNDGDEDLFVANGFTSPRTGALACTAEKPLLFMNDGAGHFTDVTASAGAALARTYSARGAVAGDLDQDGDLDLVLAEGNGPVHVLENRLANGNHSLTLVVTMAPKRADAVNVQVAVDVGGRKLVKELTSGGSYLSQGPFEAHFGLGRLPRAEGVRVVWPWARAVPTQIPAAAGRGEGLAPIPAGRRRIAMETR